MVLAIKIIAVFVLGVVGLSYLFSRLMTNPPRLRATWPTDVSIGWTPRKLVSFDGTELEGMLVHVRNAKGTVVIVHGLGDCKESYADHAEFLARNGFSVFLFDLRGHGHSGGKLCTMGYRESRDILSSIRFLQQEDCAGESIYLWGVSLGATASLLAAAEDPTVRGVIAESPFLSLEETVARHAKLFFRLPKFPMVRLMLLITRLRTGVHTSQIDVEKILPRLEDVPVSFIGGMADRRMPPETVRGLYNHKPGKKSLWLVPGAAHCEPYSVAREAYQARVLDFLESV